MEMKYIKYEKYGFALIPDLGDDPSHAKLSRLFGEERVESAGFVRIKNGKPECYGRSGSLGKSSKPEDSELLAKQFGLGEENGNG